MAGRPKDGYYLEPSHVRVPGVSTISNLLDDGKSGRFIGWAKNEVLAGRDPTKTKEKAMDAGTGCHALIEAHYLKIPVDLESYESDVRYKAETAFLNFLSWAEAYQLEPLSVEEPMVSPTLKCGTTPDLIGYIKGKLAILDWKTGGAYASSYIELAARKEIWQELHPDLPLKGGFHLLKFNRESGAFDHHYRETLPGAFETFLCLREVYDRLKEIKKYL
jgi:hypothetical protein